MTPEETISNAWECATVALYNLTYESADFNSLTSEEISNLVDQIRDIANWFDSHKEQYKKDYQTKKLQ